MSLPPDTRRRIERFLGPLYAGLDGADGLVQVGRAEARAATLAAHEPVDRRLLELLLLFHGVTDRLGSLGRDSRTALFLRGLGIEDETIGRLRAGLGRIETAPETPEEKVVHDAVLLAETGVGAVLEQVRTAGRRRSPLERIVERLDPGPPPVRFHTERGRRLAAERRAAAADWIADLRRRLDAELD